ncbi:MAG: amidohydrolase family protein [Alphaproteobacteria bacterium]|nr:amidohydrolase family protein [Alphaproteobacteria bacterium]
MNDLAIVDAHHHFWDAERNYHPWLRDQPPIPFRYGDYSGLRRRYLQADYLEDARNWRIAGSVYVETEWDPRDPLGEMAYVAELRRSGGLPSVAVAQARLDRDDAASVLERLAAIDFVRGIRHKPRANPTPRDGRPGGMADPRWRAGFAELARRGLRFDLQTPWWHLHEAADLARAFPGVTIVLDHTGLPADRSAAGIGAWKAAMAGLSACANVAVKISGLGVRGQAWTVAANRDIVLTTIDLFGTGRCMFASNYPVDGLCATWDAIYGGFDAITRGFSAAERRRLFAANAVATYAIPAADIRPRVGP